MKVWLQGSWARVEGQEGCTLIKPRLVQVSLDDKDIPCVAADEEAGTVAEVIEGDVERGIVERRGDVKIRFSNRVLGAPH